MIVLKHHYTHNDVNMNRIGYNLEKQPSLLLVRVEKMIDWIECILLKEVSWLSSDYKL